MLSEYTYKRHAYRFQGTGPNAKCYFCGQFEKRKPMAFSKRRANDFGGSEKRSSHGIRPPQQKGKATPYQGDFVGCPCEKARSTFFGVPLLTGPRRLRRGAQNPVLDVFMAVTK